MKDPPTAVKVVATILIIILLVIVALLVRAGGKYSHPEGHAVGGGGEDEHVLGDALHDIHQEQAKRRDHGHVVGPPPGRILHPGPKKTSRVGGREEKKKPKPKKPWTDYKTWEAMCKDDGATEAYWDDVAKVMNDLELDFSEVRKALAKTVYDDREWAGRINYVKGKLKVVELVPSPHAVGEGPLSRQAGAMVPSEVMAKLEAKPGLLLFHTHPGETPGSAMPSSTDMAGALHIAYTGRYAAELVVSPYGVFLYTPSAALRQKVWDVDAEDPDAHQKASLTTLRQVADLYGAFDGTRSWKSPWSLEEYATMARQYGVEYVVFPNDNYAALDQRGLYSSRDEVDHDSHQNLLAIIKEMEEEAEGQVVVEKGKKDSGRVKRVRFAPGV